MTDNISAANQTEMDLPVPSRVRWRARLRRFFLLTTLSAAALLLATWIVAGRTIAPVPVEIGAPPAELNADEITFDSESGASIAGWYASADAPRGVIVLLHPYRGSRRSMLPRALLFHDAGYSVLLYDMQAHGESPGESITFGYRESFDVKGAIDYVKRREPTLPIAIVGRSMGAAAAVMAGPLDVDALILESMYSSIDRAVDNRVRHRIGILSSCVSPLLLWQLQPRLGIRSSELRPIDNVATITCPVFVMGGERDYHTTEEETRAIYAAVRAPRELQIFAGLPHTDFYTQATEVYTESVFRFLSNHLQSPRRE